MLEIRYKTDTKKLTAWCGDPKQFNIMGSFAYEEIVILDIPIPTKPMEAYLYDEANQTLMDNPAYVEPEPPLSTHISVIDAIDVGKARPVKVKRVWEGKDYFYDCLVTESVKDQYVAGDIAVGDYVLIHFDDIGEQIVTAKVFKSW